MLKRVPLRREAASATIHGIEKFAVQAARRVVRLQERRRKLRRELKVIGEELRIAKGQLRAVTRVPGERVALDTPMPTAAELGEQIADARRADDADPFSCERVK